MQVEIDGQQAFIEMVAPKGPKLMEWGCFQFWYQPREALNSGSVASSLAF